MQQRRLRLGDILDDYCPRERRVTNHAVVAMIEDQVKQTRCTTCDAEHEYKQARLPALRRKKLDTPGAGDSAEGLLRSRPGVEPADAIDGEEPGDELEGMPVVEPEVIAASPASEPEDESPSEELSASTEDDGPVHRRLIRATLPRPEGQTPERKMPDFTVRQPGGRGGRGEADGNRPGQRHQRSNNPRRAHGAGGTNQPSRFGPGAGAPRQGSGPGNRHGSGQGQGPGQGQRHPSKRSGQPDGGGHRGGGRPGDQGPPRGGGGGGRKRGR